MNIEKILSTKERIKILEGIIYKTEPIQVNKTSKTLKISKGLISKYFTILRKEGIMKKSNEKIILTMNLETRALKILLNLSKFDKSLFKKYKFVKSAGIYGSFAKGTNNEDSDIDLWLLIEKTKEEDLAMLGSELREKKFNIKPLYLTKEKLSLIKKSDQVFYN